MDKNSYLPPQVTRELDRHVQANMSDSLKKYTGTDRPGYVPPNIQAAISKDVQQQLPNHLKQYASTYVNEKMSQPLQITHPTTQFGSTSTPPPTPSPIRRDHSMPFGEQHTIELNTLPEASKTLFQSPSGQAAVPQQLTNAPGTLPSPVEPSPSNGTHQNYEFIMNPGEQPKQKFSMPGLGSSSSLAKRISVIVGGLLVLIIVFAIASSILSGSGNSKYLLSVAQYQKEITHLSIEAASEPDISSANQTFASTVNLVMANSSHQLLSYMKANGQSVSLAQVDLLESKAVDANLSAAETSGNFNSFFTEEMGRVMNNYTNALTAAYNHTSGVHGKAFLSSYYQQAQLLKKVLSGTVDGDSVT